MRRVRGVAAVKIAPVLPEFCENCPKISATVRATDARLGQKRAFLPVEFVVFTKKGGVRLCKQNKKEKDTRKRIDKFFGMCYNHTVSESLFLGTPHIESFPLSGAYPIYIEKKR